MSPDDVARLLIVLAPMDWVVTGALLYASHHVREAALRERAEAAVVLTVGATMAGVIGLVVLSDFHLPRDMTLVLLTVPLVALSVPQLIWGVSLIRGRFR